MGSGRSRLAGEQQISLKIALEQNDDLFSPSDACETRALPFATPLGAETTDPSSPFTPQHMNGVETSRAIRLRETLMPFSDRPSITINGRLPVFAYSAQIEPEQRHELVEAGFDGALRRPVNMKRLAVIAAGVLDPACRKEGAL